MAVNFLPKLSIAFPLLECKGGVLGALNCMILCWYCRRGSKLTEAGQGKPQSPSSGLTDVWTLVGALGFFFFSVAESPDDAEALLRLRPEAPPSVELSSA